MILDSMLVEPGAFEARTGWAIKPEGACKGDVCVPLPDRPDRPGNDGMVDIRFIAERLGMPLVGGDGTWALGPESAVTGRALTTAVAPDITLPDLEGTLYDFASFRKKKLLIVAWASW